MKVENKKIKCLFDKCEVEFIPKNNVTRFCCAKHRVMWHRMDKKVKTKVTVVKQPENDNTSQESMDEIEKMFQEAKLNNNKK